MEFHPIMLCPSEKLLLIIFPTILWFQIRFGVDIMLSRLMLSGRFMAKKYQVQSIICVLKLGHILPLFSPFIPLFSPFIHSFIQSLYSLIQSLYSIIQSRYSLLWDLHLFPRAGRLIWFQISASSLQCWNFFLSSSSQVGDRLCGWLIGTGAGA